jgi:hypothetical protein
VENFLHHEIQEDELMNDDDIQMEAQENQGQNEVQHNLIIGRI